MSTRLVRHQFDQISPVYDETREPLDDATLDAMAAALRAHGIQRILEVGVGTGRVSRPLADRGFEMTGLDASSGMLRVARGKGLSRLVRGTAYRLPFREHAFDTVLFVHVLHLLDRVPLALNEGVRVGRRGVSGLVHPTSRTGSDSIESSDHDPRRLMYERLARAGYPVRARAGGPRTRERELLARFPPTSLIQLSDRQVTEPLGRRLDMVERRGSRHTLEVPPEVLHRAAEAVRAEIGDRTVTYRRIEALATWSGGPYQETTDPHA